MGGRSLNATTYVYSLNYVLLYHSTGNNLQATTLASNPGTEGGEKSAWYPLFAHALNFPTFRESRIIPRHSRGLLTSDTCTYRITIVLSQWRFYGRSRQGCFVPPATWICSDDARTRAEGIFEVSIRRDSGYALVLVSHCVIS